MRDPVAEQFASNLQRLRKRSRVSQEELAFSAGLHRTEISLLETGARTPKISTLVKICASLRTDPNTMLEGIDWQTGQMTTGGFNIGLLEHNSS
jgi:transcriptional regulator with XRE-family HTH domain